MNGSVICTTTGAGRIAKAAATRYANPANSAKVPVPRHGEIDNRLARKICQQLGITPIR
jgi:hypothetical protein